MEQPDEIQKIFEEPKLHWDYVKVERDGMIYYFIKPNHDKMQSKNDRFINHGNSLLVWRLYASFILEIKTGRLVKNRHHDAVFAAVQNVHKEDRSLQDVIDRLTRTGKHDDKRECITEGSCGVSQPSAGS